MFFDQLDEILNRISMPLAVDHLLLGRIRRLDFDAKLFVQSLELGLVDFLTAIFSLLHQDLILFEVT